MDDAFVVRRRSRQHASTSNSSDPLAHKSENVAGCAGQSGQPSLLDQLTQQASNRPQRTTRATNPIVEVGERPKKLGYSITDGLGEPWRR